MQKRLAILCSIILCCVASLAAEQQPVGYLIQTNVNEDVDEADADKAPEFDAICTRNGERIEATEGMEVYANDLIATTDKGTIAIAFLDSSAVTLRPGARLKIDDYAFPAQHTPTHLSLETGKAFFSVNPRPDDAHFFIRMITGQVEVKGTKFEVFQSALSGAYTTQVAVTSGTVTLKPNASGGTDIVDGTMVVMTIASTSIGSVNTGQTGSDITFTKTNLDKNAVKAMKAGAVTDVVVSTGKKNDVKISSVHTNVDGTKTYIKLSEINGTEVTTSTIIKGTDGKTILAKITEGKGKKSVSLIEGTLAIKESIVGTTGKASIKDKSAKKSWAGTATILGDGTEVVDCKAKDGSRVVITRQYLADGTWIKTKTTFAAGATDGTRFSETIYRDGHRSSYTEPVNSSLVATGAQVPGAAVPPLVSGAPAITTGKSTAIVPDTTPVSP